MHTQQLTDKVHCRGSFTCHVLSLVVLCCTGQHVIYSELLHTVSQCDTARTDCKQHPELFQSLIAVTDLTSRKWCGAAVSPRKKALRNPSPCAQMFNGFFQWSIISKRLANVSWGLGPSSTAPSHFPSVDLLSKDRCFPMIHSRDLPSEGLLCRGLALLLLAWI